MIGKQKKGKGFRGLLDYLESSPGSRLIGGNMSGRNARELAREFKLSRQLNPEVERQFTTSVCQQLRMTNWMTTSGAS